MPTARGQRPLDDLLPRVVATGWPKNTWLKPSTSSASKTGPSSSRPVGCSVFMYYYFDVGNSQAAHGRAPAVAIGHKTANPGSIVIAYQGDGDLASIGLAEIISTAQLGIPITVIFVNNAVYGMTGGQMAPTTLMGQRTTTTLEGRAPRTGQPLRMAELIAGLDGPVYVERVALYDNRRRTHAKRAIKKALELQVTGTGFAFIEVLSECPVHLGLEPEAAEDWVRDNMVPVFPLGVKKDITDGPAFPAIPSPTFDPDKTLAALGAKSEREARFADGFPAHLDPEDVGFKLAGSGGDGAQTAAMVIARCAINEGYDSTLIPSYGPESRGGTSYADVHVARHEVLSPAAPKPHVLVAFNAPSLMKFGPQRPGRRDDHLRQLRHQRPTAMTSPPGSGRWECRSPARPKTSGHHWSRTSSPWAPCR